MNETAALIDAELTMLCESHIRGDRLQKTVLYGLMSGGKRLRPCLAVKSAELVGGGVKDALPFACAIELIHCYSLVHDDLPAMDNDDMRRGKPSCHKACGEANAILAGDAMLTLAAETLAEVSGKDDAKSSVFRGAMDMVEGQVEDLENRVYGGKSILEMYAKKTGALFVAAVRSGAQSAGCHIAELTALTEFARSFGLMFQLADDFADALKDKEQGKQTYLSIAGREAAASLMHDSANRARAMLKGFDGQAAAELCNLIDSISGAEK